MFLPSQTDPQISQKERPRLPRPGDVVRGVKLLDLESRRNRSSPDPLIDLSGTNLCPQCGLPLATCAHYPPGGYENYDLTSLSPPPSHPLVRTGQGDFAQSDPESTTFPWHFLITLILAAAALISLLAVVHTL